MFLTFSTAYIHVGAAAIRFEVVSPAFKPGHHVDFALIDKP